MFKKEKKIRMSTLPEIQVVALDSFPETNKHTIFKTSINTNEPRYFLKTDSSPSKFVSEMFQNSYLSKNEGQYL